MLCLAGNVVLAIVTVWTFISLVKSKMGSAHCPQQTKRSHGENNTTPMGEATCSMIGAIYITELMLVLRQVREAERHPDQTQEPRQAAHPDVPSN